MAKIYIKFNGAIIREFKLEKDITTFGRKTGNDIEIGRPTISGFHGKIRRDGDRFIVEDLNSTNGTFLNGQKISSAALKNRDKIGAAGHILEFLTDDSAAASTETGPPRKTAVTPVAMPPLPGTVPPAELPPLKEPELIGNRIAPGLIRIISGGVDGQSEVHLKEIVTYVGTADQAAVKIKGFLAPSLAAVISRKAEGYVLKAVKVGYTKVNGNAIQDQVLLENGATIEAGGTHMVFYASDKKKAS